MSDGVYFVPGRGWRYDWEKFGRRYNSPVSYATEKEAVAASRARRKEVIAIKEGRELDQSNSPFLADFAELYYAWALKKKKVSGHSAFWGTEMALRFFGRRPAEPRKANRFDQRGFKRDWKYHDLTLADVLRDPKWITLFEEWMEARGISGPTKNKYRTGMSQLFDYAMSPDWQRLTGVTRNPFIGIWRDPQNKRYKTFDTPAALVKVIQACAPHQKLAVAVALYCPKFRHGSICRIDVVRQPDSTAWVNEDMTYLKDIKHKTFYKTQEPLTATIPWQLRRLIQSAVKQQKARHARLLNRYTKADDTRSTKRLGKAPCVRLIQWEGQPVGSLKKGFQAACERAGVPYGMKDGVTFHSLKHEGGTEAAQIVGISDPELQQLLGHETNAANQIYRHRVPLHEKRAVGALSVAVTRKLAAGAKGAKLFTRVG